MKTKSGKLLCMVVIVGLIVLSVFLLSQKGYGESLLIKERPINYLERGWTLRQGERTQALTVPKQGPLKIDVPKGQLYSLEADLPEAFQESQYMILRGSLQRVRVSLDGVQIYERWFDANKVVTNRASIVSSAWHFVELPSNSAGKRVKVEFESPFSDMSGLVNPIFYGAYGDAIIEIGKSHFGAFIPSFLIVLLGIGLFAFALMFKLPDRKGFAYLGLFSLGLGLWLLAESRYLQFFTGSTFYIGGSAYIFLSLMPIPFFLFIREYVLFGFKKYFNAFIAVFSINTIFVLVAQALGFMAFYESVRITHLLIFLGSLVLLIAIGYEIKFKHNQEAVFFMKALILLIIFGIFELIHFYFYGVVSVSFFVRVGFLSFICILLFHSAKNLVQLLKSNVEFEYYQKLAYEDRVTGGPNRTAFEEDFEQLFKEKSLLNGLRLVVFDLNHLKYINDTFGHVEGDKAIKMAYECISDAFGKIGKCYRIGGDEYACLIQNNATVEVDYEHSKQGFINCVQKTNQTLDYPFGIAFGEVVYNQQRHGSVKEMMYFADQKMYEDKQKRKENKR